MQKRVLGLKDSRSKVNLLSMPFMKTETVFLFSVFFIHVCNTQFHTFKNLI